MAKACIENIQILRHTAYRIEYSPNYQWGHMGACNCGFLAQEVTKLTKAEIHSSALLGYGDWNEQLNDYCPTSGLPFDHIIGSLLNQGFDIDELRNLEKLSDIQIRLRLQPMDLVQNNKDHVVLYLRKWADLLEETLLENITICCADEVMA